MLPGTVKGADAVICAYSPGYEAVGDKLHDAFASIVRALDTAGVKRLIAVGGAGSLEVAPGLQLVDSPDFPAAWKEIALKHREALQVIKNSDLDWTSLSPSAMIEPGERTGKFRLSQRQSPHRQQRPEPHLGGRLSPLRWWMNWKIPSMFGRDLPRDIDSQRIEKQAAAERRLRVCLNGKLLPLSFPIYVKEADNQLDGDGSCHVDRYIHRRAGAGWQEFLVQFVEAPDHEGREQREDRTYQPGLRRFLVNHPQRKVPGAKEQRVQNSVSENVTGLANAKYESPTIALY